MQHNNRLASDYVERTIGGTAFHSHLSVLQMLNLTFAEVNLDAPAQLKKELDTVLTLQGDLDTVDKALVTAKATFAKSPQSKEVQPCIQYLQNSQEEIQDKVKALVSKCS